MTPQQLFSVFSGSGVPIYRQLIDQVRSQVMSGRLIQGDFLPSVRQVSASLAVNPMTVSKAYSLLEIEGVVERVRGKGMRILEPQSDGLKSQRLKELSPLLEQVAAQSFQLSLELDDVMAELERVWNGNND